VKRVITVAAAVAALAFVLPPAAAHAAPWPAPEGPGTLYVHFGEEHWNDADGLTLLPKVVAESIRYRPALVTMSGDKANDGNTDELTRWRQIMEAYDRAGIPYYAGVGNHDRDVPSGQPGGTPPPGSIEPYKDVFRGRPYPMGDAGSRPADDPAGASTHYFVDHGNVRWIFVDNSCFVIEECDPFQNPSAQNSARRPQLEWLRSVAAEASRAGKSAFVVMHMPTRDPGDQSYRDTIAFNHVMGKGVGTDDNAKFEQAAQESGVDGVFVAHIKGQFLYLGQGGVPYYIDGGAGGELYTTGPIGTDHGYWHGFRLVRVDGTRITTDTVPIFVDDGITVRGPGEVGRGELVRFTATGRQPVFQDPAKVEALELRDPAPLRRSAAASGVVPSALWAAPFGLLLLAGGLLRLGVRGRGRIRVAAAAATLGCAGLTTVAAAQQSAPTSTPAESLPSPARMWTTSNPLVLSPAPSGSDDPRRDPATQTKDGAFRARCPGATHVTIASGFESKSARVVVRSARGRIVRRLRLTRRPLRSGRKRRVARLRLGQEAEVLVRVRRRGKTVRTLRHACYSRGALSFSWDGRVPRRGRLRLVRRGRYRIEVQVRSDRRLLRRSRLVRVTRR
jgi:Calcineurin-like phosphoesterase